MRTKASEQVRRYNLRNIGKKDFRTEAQIYAAVKLQSKKEHEESRTSPCPSRPQSKEDVTEEVEGDGSVPLAVTRKRKKTRQVKSVKNKKGCHDGEQEEVADPPNIIGGYDEATMQQQARSQDEEGSVTSTPSSAPTSKTWEIFSALSHAINCKTGSGCHVPNCAIASLHLENCSTYRRGSDSCTFCKVMDIMVSKHAQSCQIPSSENCPIPNCDKVRLEVEGKYNEMMDRVFRVLVHARTCNDKSCDLVLCEVMKSMLYAIHIRGDSDEMCETKAFLVQLYKHHHQTCSDQDCEVEFCKEIILKRKREALRQQLLLQLRQCYRQFANVGIPIIPPNLHSPSFLLSPGGAAAPNNMLPIPPWTPNLIPMAGNTSQSRYFYPAMPYSPLPFETTAAGMRELYNPDINIEKRQFDVQHGGGIANEATISSGNSVARNDKAEDTITEEAEQHDDLCQVTSSTKNVSHISAEKTASPTLSRLSPDDLQMLSQNAQYQQILASIKDGASYSAVHAARAVFNLQNSHEEEEDEEMDERPEDPLPESFVCHEEIQEVDSSRSENRGEMEQGFKRPHCEEQRQWGRIDFVRQIQECDDTEDTETADESENETSKYDEEDDDDDDDDDEERCGTSDPDEKPAIEGGSLTQIEKSYLDIITDQRKKCLM